MRIGSTGMLFAINYGTASNLIATFHQSGYLEERFQHYGRGQLIRRRLKSLRYASIAVENNAAFLLKLGFRSQNSIIHVAYKVLFHFLDSIKVSQTECVL